MKTRSKGGAPPGPPADCLGPAHWVRCGSWSASPAVEPPTPSTPPVREPSAGAPGGRTAARIAGGGASRRNGAKGAALVERQLRETGGSSIGSAPARNGGGRNRHRIAHNVGD